MENPSSNQIHVNLPGASAPVILPGGWSLGSEPGDAVTIIGPEGHVRVAFVIAPLKGMPEELATAAWRAFDGNFNFLLLYNVPVPVPTGGMRRFRLPRTCAGPGRGSDKSPPGTAERLLPA